MDNEVKKVWVAESYLACDYPKVSEYFLLEERPKSITVNFRGSKRVIKKGDGRFITTHKSAIVVYLNQWLKCAVDQKRHQVARLEEFLAHGLPYTVVPGNWDRPFNPEGVLEL